SRGKSADTHCHGGPDGRRIRYRAGLCSSCCAMHKSSLIALPRNGNVVCALHYCGGPRTRTTMSEVKPKRPARASRQSEMSPGPALPIEAAPPIIPEKPPAPEVVSTPPAAVAEAMPEVLSAEPAAIAEPVPEIAAAVVEPQADSGEDAWTAFTEAQ